MKDSFYSLQDGDFGGSMRGLLKAEAMLDLHSSRIDEAEVIVFNGGADIGTEIYNEKPFERGIPLLASVRDKMEIGVFKQFAGTDKLLVGICRGAQLLNCLNGGTLWQDVNHHGIDHSITDLETGVKIYATSTHHQMMRPTEDAVILAIADEATYKQSEHDLMLNGSGKSFPDDHKDVEICYYPASHSLCIQGHPEYVPGSIFANYCIDLINHYLSEIRAEHAKA